MSPGREFLDVGCGTGIAARQFQSAGCTVLGVEPDARMAEFARGTGVAVQVATFEAWQAGGRRFDAVVAGTAWHWIDPVVGAAKAALVLRPGGVLAPFGSVYQLPPAATQALAEAYHQVVPDAPITLPSEPGTSLLDAYQGLYLRAAEGISQAGNFDEPELWRYDWERAYDHDALIELIGTSGGLTSLAVEQARTVLAAVREVVDELAEMITLPYATWGLTATRTDGPAQAHGSTRTFR